MMKSITVNAQTRYYAEEGAGPPLILVHGSMSSHRQWRSLADRLRDRYRVIAADLLACAPPGSRELGAFTFAQDCDFIGQLVDMQSGRASARAFLWRLGRDQGGHGTRATNFRA